MPALHIGLQMASDTMNNQIHVPHDVGKTMNQVTQMRKPSEVRFVQAVSAALIALALSLHVLPASARAASLLAGERSEAEIQELVESMLASGDYAEGEAIVCYLPAADVGLTAQADPLAGAELLSQVTARQYAEATGEAVPAADETGFLTAQAGEEQVQVVLVRSQDVGTEELLRGLLADPRVLSAEPNYRMQFADDEDMDVVEDAQEEEALGEPDSSSDTVEDAEPLDEPAVSVEEVSTDGEADSGDELATADEQVDDTSDDTAIEEPLTSQGDTAIEEPLTAQGDTAGPASPDLTGYQWFSTGVADAIPQYLDEANLGVNVPNWNQSGATNATGVVAILDTGVDYEHPDLANVMYHFSPELQDELVCGEFGYAPAHEDTTDPMDGFDHGTHCAGIVAAEWNDFGVSGTASGVQLIAVSVTESLASDNFSYDSIIKGYDFLIRAAKAGVDIRAVNRSLDMRPATNANDVMVQAAGEVGIVTCIASGNEHEDIEAAYRDVSFLQPSPYVVRVNASNPQDGRAPFSNYGTYTTDLFSPGVSILSTIPSNRVAANRYFPSADSDPLYLKTDFSDGLLAVPFGHEVEIGDVSEGSIGYDGDNSSLKVSISMDEGAYADVYVDVPVGSLSINDVQDMVVAFNIGVNEARFASLGIQLEDDSYTDDYREGILGMSDAAPNGWVYAGLHITDATQFGQDFKRIPNPDAQGADCIRLKIGFRPYTTSYAGDAFMDVDLYIDQIAIGGHDNSGFVPYAYMNGTSMAAPIVTGGAAIVSSQIGGDPAVRAAATVRALKGAVRQAEGYRGLCKQNGQLDLSLLGSEDSLVPVIETADVVGDTLVIEGVSFSSSGTLLVAGEEAEVLSWSDDVIEVSWPDGLSSGLIPIVVRTDAGAETCRAFILEMPESVQASVSLYERDLTPPNLKEDGTSTTSIPCGFVALEDGTLFVAVNDSDDLTYSTTRSLLRSDDQGASWTPVELKTEDGTPIELNNMSIAAGDGKVFVFGEVPGENAYWVEWRRLYSVDASTGAIEQLASYHSEDSDITKSGSLAYVDGRLYFVENRTYQDGYYSAPSRMCVSRFTTDYQAFDQTVKLEHGYLTLGVLAKPKVAVAGNTLYVFGTEQISGSMDTPVEELVGLERVDVGPDGSLTCTDLSVEFSSLTDGLNGNDACVAASEEGVFLIGSDLVALLSPGEERTDTFFFETEANALEPSGLASAGENDADILLTASAASSLEPYDRTLSYGPFTYPVAVCSDGWLYAYAISNYEDTTIFGRATKVAEDEESELEPEPEPKPGPDRPDRDGSSDNGKRRTPQALPKTGDGLFGSAPLVVTMLVASVACLLGGLFLRRREARQPTTNDSKRRMR